MSLRVYAVEGFLFGVICWAWLSAEQMFVQGLVLDTFVLLGTLALGTLNLVLVSLAGPQEAPECAKCYAALILAAWFFYAYCLCDSLGLTPEGALWPPALNSTCCVNADAPALHRLALFNGGSSSGYLLWSGASAGLLTLQLLVALAGVASCGGKGATHSPWPGHGWGVAMHLLLTTQLFCYFSRFSLCTDEGPADVTSVYFMVGAVAFEYIVVGVDGVFRAQEDLISPYWSVGARTFSLFVALSFAVVTYASVHPTGLFTLPLVAYLGVSVAPAVWGFVEALLVSLSRAREAAPEQEAEDVPTATASAPAAPPLFRLGARRSAGEETTRLHFPVLPHLQPRPRVAAKKDE